MGSRSAFNIGGNAQVPVPRLPPAPAAYSQGNEASFRQAVEQAFQMRPPRQRKPLRLPNVSFHPTTNTQGYGKVAGGLTPTGSGGGEFRASGVLPKGVTIVGFNARLSRKAVGDHASVILYSIDDDGNPTNLGAVTHATTGWATLSAPVANVFVDEESHFVFLCELDNSTATGDSGILWAEIEYLEW